MTPFVERILFDRMTNGLAVFTTDSSLFEQFLIDGGLTSDEASRAREAFEEKPPHAIHGYARDGGPFPAWALTLGTEGTEVDYLGEDASGRDELGELYLDDDGNPVDCHIRRWAKRYDIFVYADHPDQCLYYYQLLKHIMVSGRSELQQQDLDQITYAGAELAPDPRYLPSNMFVRRFSINLQSDESYNEKLLPGVGPAKQVEAFAVVEPETDIDANSAIFRGVTVSTEGD
jgi:hypothetical protein